MNDYEAHLSSYDHSHKQRLKDMKAMVRDPTAGARARKAEAKADGMVAIKLSGPDAVAPSSGGFKKNGFKKTGFRSSFAPVEVSSTTRIVDAKTDPPLLAGLDKAKRSFPGSESLESDTEDEGYEIYDPHRPTD
jgi:hypothetical protein